MDQAWKAIAWRQFGAAIDMFGNALRAYPDELWRERLWEGPAARPEVGVMIEIPSAAWQAGHLGAPCGGRVRREQSRLKGSGAA